MQHQEQHAIILIGHGSLRSDSGASMIRIAARLRERGVAPVVEAAFLNYSRPTLAEVAEKIMERAAAIGAVTEKMRVIVQPYFLIAGVYVQNDLATLVASVNAQFPALTFQLAPVLGSHPALTDLAQRRVQAALEEKPTLIAPTLLLMAHGTPLASANAPLYAIADQLVEKLELAGSCVSYLDCNTPTIPDAIDQLVASGTREIVALPYFLHLGRHVAEDLPRLIAEAQARHPDATIRLAHHLDYDLCLVDAVQGLVTTNFIALEKDHADFTPDPA